MSGTPPPTLGLILAGGLARRMGGGDKALLPLAGRSLLARIVERAAPQCSGLVLNANGDPARFEAFGLPVTPDSVPGFAGPLAGILAGLDAAAEHGAEWVVSIAGDGPFIPHDLVARLHAARGAAGADLACAASGGRTHPVIGLWPTRLREDLRRALTQEDERKIDRFTARYRLAVAEWPAEPVDPFLNINDAEGLTEAERIITDGGER